MTRIADFTGNTIKADAFEGEISGSVAWDDITGKPTTFQNASQTTATAIAPGTATDVQGILAELAARITALENA